MTIEEAAVAVVENATATDRGWLVPPHALAALVDALEEAGYGPAVPPTSSELDSGPLWAR